MGVITNFLDAIRRIGGPTQRSALMRQDDYLDNKIITDRRLGMARSSVGTAASFVATIKPVPETIRPFNDEESQAIEDNSALLPEFFRVFLERPIDVWGPDDLDAAFALWAGDAGGKGYDEEAVVQILGAAFGEYCAHTLNMRWAVVTDQDGSAAAVRGVRKDYRAFPFHAIRKRIHDREQGFFNPIYVSLEQASGKDWAAIDAP
jgi:hypothetical protein